MRRLVAFALGLVVLTMVVTTAGRFLSDSDDGSRDRNAQLAPVTSTTESGARPAGDPTTVPPGSTIPGSTPPQDTVLEPAVDRYGMDEIAGHASSSSCWLLISGQVYDVTSYLGLHPAGARTITPWCGKESTEAFATEAGRGEHSDEAYSLLEEYLIGELAR